MNHSKQITILSIAVAVLFVSVLFLLYLNFYKTPTLISTPVTGIIPTAIPTADPTADWKTYNYQLFTIKLPTNWSTTSTKNPIQFLNYIPDPKNGGSFNPSTDKGKLKVEIYQNITGDSLENYIAQQKTNAIEFRGEDINWQETKTTVDGKQAIKVKTINPGFTYYLKDTSSNTIFSISFTLDFDNNKVLSDQILSTFKFTDTTLINENPVIVLFSTLNNVLKTNINSVSSTDTYYLTLGSNGVEKTGYKIKFPSTFNKTQTNLIIKTLEDFGLKPASGVQDIDTYVGDHLVCNYYIHQDISLSCYSK